MSRRRKNRFAVALGFSPAQVTASGSGYHGHAARARAERRTVRDFLQDELTEYEIEREETTMSEYDHAEQVVALKVSYDANLSGNPLGWDWPTLIDEPETEVISPSAMETAYPSESAVAIRRPMFGDAAIAVGSPDYGQNDPETDAIDAITNILHAVAKQGPDEQAQRVDRVIEAAVNHFYEEVEL